MVTVAVRWAMLALAVLAAAGCGPAGAPGTGSGTRPALATPAGSAVATPMPMETTEATMTDEDFRLTSGAFPEGGPIPKRFTCDGEDESPELAWQGAPAGTETLALIVDDPDARGFVHWVVFDITGSRSGGLARGVSASPDAAPQGTNDFGRVGWGGPCPPSGTHHYRFRLLALDTTLGLNGAPSAADLLTAAEGHVVAEATLTGTYRRGG
jgi:Raf kinase inhibitor-like YbhB/YbcL family protein